MQIRPNSINKIISLFLLVLCFLFVTCKEPADFKEDDGSPDNNNGGKPGNNPTVNGDDDYTNPNAGAVKELTFSNDSGLYANQFALTITAAAGSSIYYTTDGSVPTPNKTKYSAPITIQNRNGQANVLAANAAQFYMDPSDPRGSVPAVYQPTATQVPKATVIRAIAVSSSGEVSGVATKTYFIGSNLADYGSIRVVSLVSDPDNLVSQEKGIMVRGNSINRWDSNPPYNFRMKGEDWERPAYLEIFEGNSRSTAALSTGVGIRVRGGWSRGVGQKSFSVYFKEQYGIKNLKNYDLIPKDTTLGTTGAVKADGKTPVTQYKGFMLRNGANDLEYTKFYDVFLQDLLSDRSFSTQASVPCVVYLNGEYWGPYNFQERHSDNQTEYKYGVDKDNVISYDNGELDDGNPGEEPDFNQMITMATNDYSAFCNVFDIDNFIDYWAAEIYIYNEDWPQNNYRMWRTRNPESGNPYGDTKWRYQMFDTEFALGIYNSGRLTGQKDVNAFEKILNGEYKDHANNKLFKALLANPDFCKKFVNTMLDLYNVNFHPNNYLPKLDKYTDVYRPLMNGYFARWGRPWDSVYQNKVDDAKRYLNDIRDAMVYNYLPNYFGTGSQGIANIGVSNLYNVTLSVTGVSGVTIKINSVTPNIAGNWTGKYYSAVPITVTASPAPSGYEFEGWTVSGGTPTTSLALTTTVTLTGNAEITAKYKLNRTATNPATGINLNPSTLDLQTGGSSTLVANVVPSSAKYNTVFWHSSNSSVASVDNTGKVTAKKNGTATITASTSEDGISATCAVTVTAVVTGVTLDSSTINLTYGAQRKLTATINPSTAPNKETTWSSNNTSVATVTNDGTVTAKNTNGSAIITVTTADGNKTVTCTVNVKAATVWLDLNAKLQTLSSSTNINDSSSFSSVFSGLPIENDNFSPHTSLSITADKKLSYKFLSNSGGGIRIKAGTDPDKINFQAGDTIVIKGTFTRIEDVGFILNTSNSKAPWWKELQGWGQWSTGSFDKTFILTQSDVDDIISNGSVRINIGGIDPYDGTIYPNGTATLVLEQVKVYGYR